MSNDKCKDLSNLSIVNLDFDLWSGQAKLKEDDLIIGNGGEIPPRELASLGRKKLIDPKMLNPFTALKTRAETICLTHGMKFLNPTTYAVPKDRIATVDENLKKIEPEMQDMIDDFLLKYQKGVDDWASANPNYAEAIRLAAPTEKDIRSRFGFQFDIINVNASFDTGDASDKLSKRVEKLDSDLMNEVANDATKFFLNNFSGKTSCRVQTRQTLRRIRDKVDGLSFLNSSFLPLVKLLDETINGYDMHRDKKGFIKGAFFYQIIAVTLIMSDVDKIHAYAQGSVSPDLMASEMMPDSEYIHPSQPQQVLPEQQSLKAQAHDSTPVDTVNPSETATVNADASSDVESDQVAPTTAENAVTHEVISDSSESVMQEPSLDIDPFDFDALVDEIMPAEVDESTVQEVIEVAETDQEAEKDDAVPVTESPVLFPGMESMAAPTYAVNETDHAIVPLEEEVELAQTLIPADKVQTSEIEEAFF